MKDIVLIANYWHFKEEKASSRYRTMADIIVDSGYNLEVITSTFRHFNKKQRSISTSYLHSLPYKVTLIREPGYKKNISLQRLYSHYIFGKNVGNYLRKRNKPDVIILSVPSLHVGLVVSEYAKKNGVKLIVDIQDLWPEAFKMAINIPLISDLLFLPLKLQANKIYSRADKIMAVSDTYKKRGLEVNSKDAQGLCLYIGSDLNLIEKCVRSENINKKNNNFYIAYIGTLGKSYDINLIIDAIHYASYQCSKNIIFKVMGDGELRNEFEMYAKKQNIACEFTGFMEYGQMMSELQACDIAVNPIIGTSASSIINKVSDYAMAGLPVINSQNSEEYQALITEYDCGINCKSGDREEVTNAILYFINNPNALKKMSRNSLTLGLEKFDRRKTYMKVVNLIEECLGDAGKK